MLACQGILSPNRETMIFFICMWELTECKFDNTFIQTYTQNKLLVILMNFCLSRSSVTNDKVGVSKIPNLLFKAISFECVLYDFDDFA